MKRQYTILLEKNKNTYLKENMNIFTVAKQIIATYSGKISDKILSDSRLIVEELPQNSIFFKLVSLSYEMKKDNFNIDTSKTLNQTFKPIINKIIKEIPYNQNISDQQMLILVQDKIKREIELDFANTNTKVQNILKKSEINKNTRIDNKFIEHTTKALSAVKSVTHQDIMKVMTSEELDKKDNSKLIYKIIGAILLIVGIILVFNRKSNNVSEDIDKSSKNPDSVINKSLFGALLIFGGIVCLYLGFKKDDNVKSENMNRKSRLGFITE